MPEDLRRLPGPPANLSEQPIDMTPEEKNLITGLFQRLRSSDAASRDQEADQLIRTLVTGQPSAPYLLAQTVLVQEHALQNAQARIAQLERQAVDGASPAAQPQSFLSGLLHPRSSTPPPPPAPAAASVPAYAPAPQPPPYPSTVGMAPSAAGGFLKGALGTAAGVAGGALLFEGISNLLGHHAGPFGSSLGGFGGGGSFTGGLPTTENVENVENVTNNYYEAPEGRESRDSSFLPADNDYTSSNDDSANYAGNDQGSGNDPSTDDSGNYDSGDGGGDSLA